MQFEHITRIKLIVCSFGNENYNNKFTILQNCFVQDNEYHLLQNQEKININLTTPFDENCKHIIQHLQQQCIVWIYIIRNENLHSALLFIVNYYSQDSN